MGCCVATCCGLPRVAVGTAVARRPPRRSRRVAFPHRAPVSGRTRSAFGVWGTHAAPIRGLAASVTCRSGAESGACVATHPPLDRPPSLHRLRRRCHSALFEASQVQCSRPTSHPRACPSFGCCLHVPVRCARRTRMRSPRFRTKDVSTCMGSSTARGSSSTSHLRGEDVAFSSTERDRHLGVRPVSLLHTQPMVPPVNASS